MSNSKFIMLATGPLLKYRLDIIREVSPKVKNYIIIFTDKFSHDLYSDHHDFFNFVLMDEYRINDEFSLKNELLLQSKTEQDFLSKYSQFYGTHSGKYYPWELHRFIFPYLIQNNIYNFVITQTDFILKNDEKVVEEFFSSIPKGTLLAPWMREKKENEIYDILQKTFPEFKMEDDKIFKNCDGFFKGFHFYNKEDMKLFYDIWCESIKVPILKQISHRTAKTYKTEFINSWLMEVFSKHKKYVFSDMNKYTHNSRVGKHYTRPEDTLYVGERHQWKKYNFDYQDVSSISSFIKNNKIQLETYYIKDSPYEINMTDTHVFTYFK